MDNSPGSNIANFGSEVFGVLLTRIYKNGFKETAVNDRSGFKILKSYSSPEVELLDPETAGALY